MAPKDDFLASLKKARSYGLGEFLEIVGEMSQVSTRKGTLGRKTKELITLGMALAKQCKRCINIHTKAAEELGATKKEIIQVKKIALFIKATPRDDKVLWESWKDSWRVFSMGKGPIEHYERELIALGIALVNQYKEHIVLHTHYALKHGATQTQIFEVMPLALLMDGAPALSQIGHLVEALEKNS